MVAALFGAGQPQMLAAQVEQRRSDIDLDVMRLTIETVEKGLREIGVADGW
ncbi:hypothetical protein [Sphingomonas sanguinis]|jgi:hypothetical protein|uniref:hypothetical protein n=1 Tax=Sphingomonas sanguinis TaxID=33051 RepID=UPI0019D1CC3C|nr:hypothetical protein [Sphingomonas sanguinis]